MLSHRDRLMINRDVARIISDWSYNNIEIWTPLPKEQQPGWDNMMREVRGDIVYDKQLNIPFRRYDTSISSTEANVGGVKRGGYVTVHVPLFYAVDGNEVDITISDESIVILDGSKWYIDSRHNRPGEHVLRLVKRVGGK